MYNTSNKCLVILNYLKKKNTVIALYLIIVWPRANTGLFAQQITLSKRNVTIESALKYIREQSGYDFFFDANSLPKDKLINIYLANANIDLALKNILREVPLTYSIEGKIVSIRKHDKSAMVQRQKKNIAELIIVKGRIIGPDGHRLVGASVSIKGTSIGTFSDEEGYFVLRGVSETAILKISHLGYYDKELKVRPDLGDIKLEIQSSSVEAVDVIYSTGYQNFSRDRSAGSFSKPNLNIMKNRSYSTSVIQRLDGLIPGLVINNSEDSNPVLIRGLSSINSSQSPLVVVDGVEVINLRDLNMLDIDDITVLKDASSAAIWGAKAANGVIVITTKKGRLGQELGIDYDSYFNIEQPPNLNYLQRMTSKEFITTVKELFPQYVGKYPWSSVQMAYPVTPHLDIQYAASRGLISSQRADQMLDSLASIDNRKHISNFLYRQGMMNNHTISASSGGKVHSFYGSLNYIISKPVNLGAISNGIKVNFRQDLRVNKYLQMFLLTDLGTDRSRQNKGGGIPDPFPIPYQLLQDADGKPLTVNYLGNYSDSFRMDYQARSRVNLDYVPLDEVNLNRSNSTRWSARLLAGGTVNIYKGLKFQGVYGYNTTSSYYSSLLDQESYPVRQELMTFTKAANTNVTPVYFLPSTGGRLLESNDLVKNWTIRNQLSYDADWNNENQITVLIGQEATSNTPYSRTITHRGWNDQLQKGRPVDYETLSKGISGTVPGGTRVLLDEYTNGGVGVVSRRTSYYANINYSYLSKYTINSSWRIDQSNLFGIDKSAQNRPVYSVGARWALSREGFMWRSNWLSDIALRFTYGITGNAPIPGTATSKDILRSESNASFVNGMGLIIKSPANRSLTWEETTTYNAGVDFDILNGRLTGTIDAYVRKTKDLIGEVKTPPLTGFATVTGNYGSINNKGIDIALNSRNIMKKDFQWSSEFTLGFNKNKITSLAPIFDVATANQLIWQKYMTGYSADALFAYKYAGLNTSGDPQIFLADGKISSSINADVPENLKFMGTSQPIWNGGFSNSFRYKNLQLDVNMSYSFGHRMFRDNNGFWTGVPYTNKIHPEFVNRWKKAGDEKTTDIPRYVTDADIDNSRSTSYYVYSNTNIFNASFIKIRDITLSYTITPSLVQKLGAKSLNLRFQVSNVMFWKANAFGIDPEFHFARGSRNLPSGQGLITVGANLKL